MNNNQLTTEEVTQVLSELSHDAVKILADALGMDVSSFLDQLALAQISKLEIIGQLLLVIAILRRKASITPSGKSLVEMKGHVECPACGQGISIEMRRVES